MRFLLILQRMSVLTTNPPNPGYSVFAVCPVDPNGDSLIRTDVDELAGTLPQPTSAGTRHLNTSRVADRPTLGSSNIPGSVEGAEDEDLMLQAALQASMAGADHEIPDWLRNQANEAHTRQVASGASSRPGQESLAAGSFNLPGGSYGEMPGTFDEAEDLDASADPVAASTARNRAFMENMRRQQEMALRGAIDDDIMHHAHRARQGPAVRPARAALPQPRQDVAPPRRRRTAGEDDEEIELQRALAASQAAEEAAAASNRPNRFAGLRGENEDGDDDEDVVMEDDDEELTMYRRAQQLRQSRQPLAPIAPEPAAPRTRVYDDDDEELQAALRASLETVPDGFVLPPSPQAPLRRPTAPSSSAATGARLEIPGPKPTVEEEPVSSPPPEVALTAEELRKKRLARFGG